MPVQFVTSLELALSQTSAAVYPSSNFSEVLKQTPAGEHHWHTLLNFMHSLQIGMSSQLRLWANVPIVTKPKTRKVRKTKRAISITENRGFLD